MRLMSGNQRFSHRISKIASVLTVLLVVTGVAQQLYRVYLAGRLLHYHDLKMILHNLGNKHTIVMAIAMAIVVTWVLFCCFWTLYCKYLITEFTSINDSHHGCSRVDVLTLDPKFLDRHYKLIQLLHISVLLLVFLVLMIYVL